MSLKTRRNKGGANINLINQVIDKAIKDYQVGNYLSTIDFDNLFSSLIYFLNFFGKQITNSFEHYSNKENRENKDEDKRTLITNFLSIELQNFSDTDLNLILSVNNFRSYVIFGKYFTDKMMERPDYDIIPDGHRHFIMIRIRKKEDISLLEKDILSFNIQPIFLRLILLEMRRYFKEKDNISIQNLYDFYNTNYEEFNEKIVKFLNNHYKFLDETNLTDKLTIIYDLIEGDNKKEKLLFQIYIYLQLFDAESGKLDNFGYYFRLFKRYNNETYEDLKIAIEELLEKKTDLLKKTQGGLFERQRIIKVIRKY